MTSVRLRNDGSVATDAARISPALMKAIVDLTVGKDRTGSYVARRLSIETGKDVFADHPWLGVGWGNHTVHDLPVKILSNTGVIGAACLLVVLFGLLFGRLLPEHTGALRPELRALKLAVAMSVAMDWVAGWGYPYGEIWIISGLLLAAMTLGPSTGAPVVGRGSAGTATTLGGPTEPAAEERPVLLVPEDLARR